MKKSIFVLLCVSVFSFNILAQTGNPSSSPNPNSQTQNPNPAATPTTKRPPVLQGESQQPRRTVPAPTPSPAPNGKTEDKVEDDDEVIRVETNLVTMPVSVLDRDGRFIGGLRKQDFQIYEDGVLQKIDTFGTVEQPFTVVLLIDVSPSTQYQITEIQDAAIAFVNQLRPNDRVIVMSFDQRVRVLSPATSDRTILRNAILQTDFGNGTSLYEAVDFTLNRQLAQIQGRKAVVIFTDGVDTTSNRATYESSVREAEESEALIYSIRYDTFDDMSAGRYPGGGGGYPNPSPRRRAGNWPDILGDILGGGVTIGGNTRGGGRRVGRSSGGSVEDYERGEQYLEELARNSGGRVFEANANRNLTAAFSGIAEELRRQYTLGYYPEDGGQPGQRKQIRVRVNRPNAVVRAKNSYIVSGSGGANSANSQPPPATKKPPQIMNRLPF
jgi:Ca-activated chloride channel homolog